MVSPAEVALEGIMEESETQRTAASCQSHGEFHPGILKELGNETAARLLQPLPVYLATRGAKVVPALKWNHSNSTCWVRNFHQINQSNKTAWN